MKSSIYRILYYLLLNVIGIIIIYEKYGTKVTLLATLAIFTMWLSILTFPDLISKKRERITYKLFFKTILSFGMYVLCWIFLNIKTFALVSTVSMLFTLFVSYIKYQNERKNSHISKN